MSCCGQPARGDPPAYGLNEGLTGPHRKINLLRNVTRSASDLDAPFETT